jgi:hypothetical protein
MSHLEIYVKVKKALLKPVPLMDPKWQWSANMNDAGNDNNADYDDDNDDHDGKKVHGNRPKTKRTRKKNARRKKGQKKLGMPSVPPLLPPLIAADVNVTPDKKDERDMLTPVKQRRGKHGPPVDGMQTSVPVSPKKPKASSDNVVSYSALMAAFMALAQHNGQSKPEARANWLASPQRANSIAQMSNGELCRRRMGPYAVTRVRK